MDNLVIFLAKYLIFIILIVAVVSFLKVPRREWPRYFLIAILAGLLALVLAQIGGLLYNNPRPFVELGKAPLVPHGADNGFPSSHMLLASLTACIVFIYNRRLGVVLFVGAILVGLGRILALVHHPIDIVASVIISIAATYVAYLIAGHVKVQWQKRRPSNQKEL